MTALELWTQTALAKALGWTLLHSLWEGAVAGLLLAAALAVLRQARARYAAACLALLGTLAGFVVTLVRLWPAAGTGGVRRPISLVHTPQDALPFFSDQWTHVFRASDLLPWLAPFWIAGVLAFHLRTLAGWAAARRLRTSGVCIAAGDWPARLERLTARLRVSRPVTLLESSLADAPLVIGYLKPVILMPVGLLAGLPAAQVEAILAHELAHICRQDYLVNLLQTMVEGLLFYHPAVWWMSHVIRAERENCCDDLAVAVSGDARGYAAALAALEETRWAARELALAATGGSLVKRIRRLLQKPEGARATLAPVVSTVVLMGLTAAALAAWQTTPPQATAPPPAEPQGLVTVDTPNNRVLLWVKPDSTAQKQSKQPTQLAQTATALSQTQTNNLTTPYRKWLNEDVAYIITDQERNTFKGLQSDAARETFIDQFWKQRDPTPNTEENEFKEEHYRRIAYANEHFASFVAGWKTDRGRIYITYGAPDEIEDHSSGGTYERPPAEGGGTITSVPFQQWRYRYIEGVGNNIIIEFVDPSRTNEYRMTTDPSEKDASRNPQMSYASTGGDPQVTVQVSAGGRVRASVESAPMPGQWELMFDVLYGGQSAANAKDHLNLPANAGSRRLHYDCTFQLSPGAYTMNVVIRDPSGASQTRTVNFYVN
jgi:GWxTD domain-containing protein